MFSGGFWWSRPLPSKLAALFQPRFLVGGHVGWEPPPRRQRKGPGDAINAGATTKLTGHDCESVCVCMCVCEPINPVSAGGAGELPGIFLLCGVSTPEGSTFEGKRCVAMCCTWLWEVTTRPPILTTESLVSGFNLI